MRFNYKTYPLLESLYNGNLCNFRIWPADENYFSVPIVNRDFTETWNTYAQYFRSDINVVANSFSNAAMRARQSLGKFLFETKRTDPAGIELSGTYIDETFTHCLYFVANGITGDNKAVYFVFDKQARPVMYLNELPGSLPKYWVSSICQPKDRPAKIWIEDVPLLVSQIFSLFKKYAEIETRILLPHSKTHDIRCNYGKSINETGLHITFLNSLWFTNLIKSDAFSVSGHFRFQPCGKMLHDRKLIWINEFEKEGYNRPADMVRLAEDQ